MRGGAAVGQGGAEADVVDLLQNVHFVLREVGIGVAARGVAGRVGQVGGVAQAAVRLRAVVAVEEVAVRQPIFAAEIPLCGALARVGGDDVAVGIDKDDLVDEHIAGDGDADEPVRGDRDGLRRFAQVKGAHPIIVCARDALSARGIDIPDGDVAQRARRKAPGRIGAGGGGAAEGELEVFSRDGVDGTDVDVHLGEGGVGIGVVEVEYQLGLGGGEVRPAGGGKAADGAGADDKDAEHEAERRDAALCQAGKEILFGFGSCCRLHTFHLWGPAESGARYLYSIIAQKARRVNKIAYKFRLRT